MKNNSKSIVVGLTGGIATGKSTLMHYFSHYPSIQRIDCDAIVRDILTQDVATIQKVREIFGNIVFDDNGHVQRHILRDIIVDSPIQKNRLESIIHPVCSASIKQQVSASQLPFIIIDIPLLFKNKWDNYVDYICSVYSSYRIQVLRLARRDNITLRQASKIIHTFTTVQDKWKIDFSIDNSKSYTYTCVQIKRFLRIISEYKKSNIFIKQNRLLP